MTLVACQQEASSIQCATTLFIESRENWFQFHKARTNGTECPRHHNSVPVPSKSYPRDFYCQPGIWQADFNHLGEHIKTWLWVCRSFDGSCETLCWILERVSAPNHVQPLQNSGGILNRHIQFVSNHISQLIEDSLRTNCSHWKWRLIARAVCVVLVPKSLKKLCKLCNGANAPTEYVECNLHGAIPNLVGRFWALGSRLWSGIQ